MARFRDTLDMLRSLPELPDTWGDDLGSAYDDDIVSASGPIDSANAKVAELTSALEDATNELNKVKAHNYELMMQIGQPGTGDEDKKHREDDELDDDDDDVDDAQKSIDELFTGREDK